MTVSKVVDRRSHFEWLSTDTRPAAGLSVGDLGYETDTKKWFLWNKTDWVFTRSEGLAVELIGGANYQLVKVVTGAVGEVTDVSETEPLPVEVINEGPLLDARLFELKRIGMYLSHIGDVVITDADVEDGL